MQSEFHKIAKKIVKRDKDVLDTLIEFEKTKKRLNFTIDKGVARQFQEYCREKGYNMSAKIEKAMKELILKDE